MYILSLRARVGLGGENLAFFWYYNNGITAITYLSPVIGEMAVQIKLRGLQIINGVQTVYSIYRAYKDATPIKREQMDSESLVTLRLLKSGGKDFDLNVTRYTNSQNPINDRDFYANDDIQIMLQNTSYETNTWYEKRHSEFRETPKNVEKVPNYVFANVYLAYHLQDPVGVVKNYHQRKINEDLNFVSYKEHKDGLYEKIFNDETKFENMVCAFYLFKVICDRTSIEYKDSFTTSVYYSLALFKVTFAKYVKAKFNDKRNISKYIIKIYEQGDQKIIIQTFKFINQFIKKQIEISENRGEKTGRMLKFLFKPLQYERVKKILEDLEISVVDIENLTIEHDEKLIEGETDEDNNSETDDGYISV